MPPNKVARVSRLFVKGLRVDERALSVGEQLWCFSSELFETVQHGGRISPGELGEDLHFVGVELAAVDERCRLHCGELELIRVGLRDVRHAHKLSPGLLELLEVGGAIVLRTTRGGSLTAGQVVTLV